MIAVKRLVLREICRQEARPSSCPGLPGGTAGWRRRPNPVSALESSANGAARQSTARSYLMKVVPRRLPRCRSSLPRLAGACFLLIRNEVVRSTKRASTCSSTDSHPSDKNKGVRWMGHTFVSRGSATPVGDSKGNFSLPASSPNHAYHHPRRTLCD